MKVYSFDVFDTCVARCYPRPTDLFYPLAAAVLARTRGEGAFGREEVFELVRGRIAAEREAQRTKTRGDVTLENIYRAFPALDAWGIDPQMMQEEEVALELRSVRPISEVKSRIEALRARGARVIYISDMYLPRAVIWRMLAEQGIAEEGENLYVSGELGVTKRSGRLFDHVLKAEGLKPGELEHYGDNVYGDFFAARKRGVKAGFFTASQPNRFEEALLHAAPDAPHEAALVAGASRAVRLAAPFEAATAHPVALAANVLAPLLTGFVLWVLEDARARSLERLYFTNTLMLDVAKTLAPGDALQLRQLYVPEAWRLTPKEGHEAPVQKGEIQDSYQARASQGALESPSTREEALAYFRREGLLDGRAWAFVDLGWMLGAQRSLKGLLDAGGQPYVFGYYLGLAKNRVRAFESGPSRAFFLEEVEAAPGGGAPLFGNKELLEHLLTAARGDGRGDHPEERAASPSMSASTSTPVSDARVGTLRILVRETILSFAREAARTELAASGGPFREAARAAVNLFLSRPTRRDARAVADILGADARPGHTAPPVQALGVGTAYRLGRAAGGLLRPRSRRRAVATIKGLREEFFWLEGSAALSGPLARPLLWAVKKARGLRKARKGWATRAARVMQGRRFRRTD